MQKERCELCKRLCTFSKVNCASGRGKKTAAVMLVGEAMGRTEEEAGGVPFIGDAGMFLENRILRAVGLRRDELFMTNAVRCRPPQNKTPTVNEVRNCRSYLVKEIKRIKPKVIILLGNVPLNSALVLFKKRKEEEEKKSGGISGITKWRGKVIWHNEFNCWVVPTFHPSHLRRLTQGRNLLANLSYKNALDDFELALSCVDKDIPTDNNPKTRLLTKYSEFSHLLNKMLDSDYYAFDTETTGLDVYKDKITGASFANSVKGGYYLDWKLVLGKKSLRKRFQELLLSKANKKILHNGSFDVKMLANGGFKVSNGYYDTMIASHLVDENFPKGLKDNTWRYLTFGGYELELDQYIRDNKVGYGDVPIDIMAPYGAKDAVATYRLYKGTETFEGFESIMKKENTYDIYTKICMPVRPVLDRIELRGIKWDKERAVLLEGKMEKLMSKVENKIYKVVGHKFNINSRPQLSKVLYDELKLKSFKVTKTKQRSTAKDVIESFKKQTKNRRGSLVAHLLSDSSYLKKQRSTFVKGLYKFVDSNGRIHANYNSTGTVTGRLSCSNPSLHNIPRDEVIRTLFIAEEGRSLICADIKSAELRVLAAYSGEEALIDAFRRNIDIHTQTYRIMFGTAPDYVPTDDERMLAKAINFGLVYGRGPKSLAETLNVSIERAKKLIEQYFYRLPKVKKFLRDNIRFAHRYGYVVSLFGRRRRLPEIHSDDYAIMSSVERQANNSIIQSVAADYTYIGACRVERAFKERRLDAFLVHTVHDCVISSVEDFYVEKAKKLVKFNLERPIKAIPVKMEVDLHVTKRWGEGGDSKVREVMQRLKSM